MRAKARGVSSWLIRLVLGFDLVFFLASFCFRLGSFEYVGKDLGRLEGGRSNL